MDEMDRKNGPWLNSSFSFLSYSWMEWSCLISLRWSQTSCSVWVVQDGWSGLIKCEGNMEEERGRDAPKQVDVDRVFGLFWVVQVGMAWANQVRR